MEINKAQQEAITRYHKKHKFQGPLTEAQENAAYEDDMRRRDGGKDPNKAKNWDSPAKRAARKEQKVNSKQERQMRKESGAKDPNSASNWGFGSKRKPPKVR